MLTLTLAVLLQATPDRLDDLRQRYESAATEQARYESHWKYGVALLRAAEKANDPDLYRRTVAVLTDFVWKYEDHVDSLVAHLMISRAHRALAEWGPCFRNLRLARRDENRDDLAEIAARSWIEELRARAERHENLDRAIEESGQHLLRNRKRLETDAFLNLRIQRAQALHVLDRKAESEKILRKIVDTHADDDAATTALKALADLVGRTGDIRRFADLLFERGHFTTATTYYARLHRTPDVWDRLGTCYARTGRLHEAVVALGEACKVEGRHQIGAAVRLERVLRHLAGTFHDEKTRRRLREHRAWMETRLDPSKLGPAPLMVLADGKLKEGRYAEAAALYAQIRPGQQGHEDAVHAIGWCRYRLKEYDKALTSFRTFLGFADRAPRDVDTSIDLATWSLLHLDRAEEALAFTGKHVPANPKMKEWRLAHRVDALARLGRFDEATRTLRSMKESVAHRPTIRALERLSAGYEAAIRRTGNRALWGRYARVVVELSEKTFRPLSGAKLRAAADALSLEGTPEAYRLAFDLYGSYLLEGGLPEPERRSVLQRRAEAALGGGRLDRAIEIADTLLDEAPDSGTIQELRADILMARYRDPGRTDRDRDLGHAVEAYGRLAGALKRGEGEHFYRLAWKYADALFEQAPDRARDFFTRMEARGYGNWDRDRWGYASKMKTLRARILKAVPPRR